MGDRGRQELRIRLSLVSRLDDFLMEVQFHWKTGLSISLWKMMNSF